ncbi:MAG: hypothetical protein WB778_06155 [Thermoplasmata archaeon]
MVGCYDPISKWSRRPHERVVTAPVRLPPREFGGPPEGRACSADATRDQCFKLGDNESRELDLRGSHEPFNFGL